CVNCGAQLSATAKFCSECAHPADPAAPSTAQRFGAPESYTPKHLAERIINSKTALEGERKQVTVLFADLKGSMELLADRDPEEARKILDPVLELMMEAVHRYEGTVNQVMGDGIMALFGAPLAHEDHAVRASYAALDLQRAMRRLTEELRRSHGVTVEARVGLNSGEVVVRSISSDLHLDYTAVGQTTHLAARMEQLARPGTILVPGATPRPGPRPRALPSRCRRRARPHPAGRARGGASGRASGGGEGRGRPRSGRGHHRGAGGRQVPARLGADPLAAHGRMAGARGQRRPVRQDDPLPPGPRAAAGVLPDRGGGRRAPDPRENERQGAGARRGVRRAPAPDPHAAR